LKKLFEAIKEAGVGIKCSTITPDEQKCKEIGTQLRSPNHIIREYLGGVNFRVPVICENIPRIIKSWVNPIYIARHAYAGNKVRFLEYIVLF
jgi:isocitrate dehydrogenase